MSNENSLSAFLSIYDIHMNVQVCMWFFNDTEYNVGIEITGFKMDTHLSLILKCGHNKQCSKIESSKEKYKTGT